MRALHMIAGCFALLLTMAVAPGHGVAADDAAPMCTPRDSCCKVCSKGQACGDSCISRDKQCHQPPGCACDRANVCG